MQHNKHKIRYKVLSEDLKSPFQSYKYKIGKEYHCKNFDNNPNNQCSKGYYATNIDGILYANLANNRQVFECEVWGEAIEIDQYKMRYENIKLTRKLEKLEIIKLLNKKDYGFNIIQAVYPIQPFSIAVVVNDNHIDLLKQWIRVCNKIKQRVSVSATDSILGSDTDITDDLGGAVCNSLIDMTGDPAYVSAWHLIHLGTIPVKKSVWDLIGAYYSSMFPTIKKWKYIDHKEGKNPFQPAIDLWNEGLVPSFDGETWRLHGGKNAEILHQI